MSTNFQCLFFLIQSEEKSQCYVVVAVVVVVVIVVVAVVGIVYWKFGGCEYYSLDFVTK
jgi:hypothetical protein